MLIVFLSALVLTCLVPTYQFCSVTQLSLTISKRSCFPLPDCLLSLLILFFSCNLPNISKPLRRVSFLSFFWSELHNWSHCCVLGCFIFKNKNDFSHTNVLKKKKMFRLNQARAPGIDVATIAASVKLNWDLWLTVPVKEPVKFKRRLPLKNGSLWIKCGI